MLKRGQVTIFIILGIIIVVALVLGITMRKDIAKAVSSSEEKEALSFTEQSAEVKKHVEGCLKESLIKAKGSIPPLNIAPEDYNAQLSNAVAERTGACLNFVRFQGLEITSDKDILIEILRNTKLTSVTAIARFKLSIKQGDKTESFSEFKVSLNNFAPVSEAA